jgi:hypothetical protein
MIDALAVSPTRSLPDSMPYSRGAAAPTRVTGIMPAVTSLAPGADELSDDDLETVVGGLARAWGTDVEVRLADDARPTVLVTATHKVVRPASR